MLHQKTVRKGAAVLLLAAGAVAAQAQNSPRKLLDPANMDTKVRPQDNFYRYANGAWLDANPIPASETRWGSFNELQEGNYAALHTLLNEAAADRRAAPGSREGKIGTFYRNGMDSAAIDRMGITPLKSHFARIDAINSPVALLQEIALEHTMGVGPLFGFYVGPDDKNVTRMICNFYQGGLGMPDRDYYFKTDARSSKIRDAYQQYLTKMVSMMGNDQPAAMQMGATIFKLETALAGASMTRVEMRDPYALYNKFAVSSLDEKFPGLAWKTLLGGLRVAGQDSVLIAQPAFFREVGKQLRSTPLTTWKAYLKFHLLNETAPFLSNAYDEARFDFYGRTVRGQKEQRPRWKRVMTVIDGSIGELLGQLYVDRYFKPEAKARMLELVNNLQQTYADRINRLDWMSAATKQKALAKLNTFMKKIGYPDKWKDYGNLQITGKDYLANVLAASSFEYTYNLSKLGRPVDRTEWGMTPPTVNAYYNPAFNEIVFPAGILRYPFFDFSADDAVNYGGIGAVIGHEMTHGFDDQGRQYDAEGNLKDWWTPADSAAFMKRANMVVQQFNNYTVLDTVHVNGELTLGENLADLGGLAIAYEAFQKTKEAKEGKKIDGFTPNQRFFLSWAQVWRANTRPEEMASRIVTDPHSPSELRGNGPLTNLNEFYEAFDVKKGDKMYREPADRAKVW